MVCYSYQQISRKQIMPTEEKLGYIFKSKAKLADDLKKKISEIDEELKTLNSNRLDGVKAHARILFGTDHFVPDGVNLLKDKQIAFKMALDLLDGNVTGLSRKCIDIFRRKPIEITIRMQLNEVQLKRAERFLLKNTDFFTSEQKTKITEYIEKNEVEGSKEHFTGYTYSLDPPQPRLQQIQRLVTGLKLTELEKMDKKLLVNKAQTGCSLPFIFPFLLAVHRVFSLVSAGQSNSRRSFAAPSSMNVNARLFRGDDSGPNLQQQPKNDLKLKQGK